jgi:hypothetical protein
MSSAIHSENNDYFSEHSMMILTDLKEQRAIIITVAASTIRI